MNRCIVLFAEGRVVDAVVEQKLDGSQCIVSRRMMQRCPSVLVLDVQISNAERQYE